MYSKFEHFRFCGAEELGLAHCAGESRGYAEADDYPEASTNDLQAHTGQAICVNAFLS